jgi:hypothetical protein
MLGTLADVYANPIMVEALILGREGTTFGGPHRHHQYGPSLPRPIDDPDQLERWEPWIRAYIAVGDLLQGIRFQRSGNNAFQVRSYNDVIATIERPHSRTFNHQIRLVLSWAELREERATEIMAQIDPQYAFWSSILYLHPDRTRRTFELINMVLQLCVYVEMRFKQAMACWRPVEYNAEVQPMITTPGHGSFPMGHATQVYAVIYVLKKLTNLDPRNEGHRAIIDQLDRQAARIATNRVIAGVHFPVDTMAGRMLGTALGEYFAGRSTGRGNLMRRRFKAGGIDAAPGTDFNPFSNQQDLDNSRFYASRRGAGIALSAIMRHMWREAREEVRVRFP